MSKVLRQLRKHYDPLALCYGLGKLTNYGQPPWVCDNTFRYTRAVLARAAPDVDADAVIHILEESGQHCDCEVMLNICPGTGA